MLRSDLCDFNDAYIVVKGIVTVSADERDRDEMNRQVILKNNAPFISCISKINGVLVQNAKDLDIVMPMYSLLEYSKNYSKTSASLWNYYRNELTDDTNDNNGPNKSVINSKSVKYKTSIIGSTYNVPRRITGADGNPVDNPNSDQNKSGTREIEIAVPLKHLGNFWNSLNIPLINCEVSLALSWSANCVITSMEKRLSKEIIHQFMVILPDSSGSLYQFKRDESPTNDNGNPNNVALDNSTSFKYKASILRKATDGNDDKSLKNIKLVVPLKYLSNFFRSLEMPLINCKMHLELNWNNNCVMYGADTYADGENDNDRETTFQITSTKLYVPVVTLSTKDNENLTKQLDEGFKRSVYWNEYQSK